MPRDADETVVRPPNRMRQKLVIVFIGLLVGGVLALIAAAALTILSEDEFQPPAPPELEPASASLQDEAAPKSSVADDAAPAPQAIPAPSQKTTPVPTPASANDALIALTSRARAEIARKEELRPQALALVAELASLPPAEGARFSETLRLAAETWRMPEAWLALAALAKDDAMRLEHYLQAASLGHPRARSLAGRALLQQGVNSGHRGVIQQAVAQLSAAVVAGDLDAMFALGDAYYHGKGVSQARTEGRALVERAAKLGHAAANDWLKKNR
jgi:TPR repeat protein